MMIRRIIVLTAAAALPLAVSAQIFHPDNEWRSFFVPNFDSATLAPASARGMPKLGDVSADGQLVYLGDNRGWQPRPFVYVFDGARLVHASDCPYVFAQSKTKSANSGRAG